MAKAVAATASSMHAQGMATKAINPRSWVLLPSPLLLLLPVRATEKSGSYTREELKDGKERIIAESPWKEILAGIL